MDFPAMELIKPLISPPGSFFRESRVERTVPRSPQHGGAINVTTAGKQMYNICITYIYIYMYIYIYTFKEKWWNILSYQLSKIKQDHLNQSTWNSLWLTHHCGLDHNFPFLKLPKLFRLIRHWAKFGNLLAWLWDNASKSTKSSKSPELLSLSP